MFNTLSTQISLFFYVGECGVLLTGLIKQANSAIMVIEKRYYKLFAFFQTILLHLISTCRMIFNNIFEVGVKSC